MKLQEQLFNAIKKEIKECAYITVDLSYGVKENIQVYAWTSSTEIIVSASIPDIGKISYKALVKQVMKGLLIDKEDRDKYEASKSTT